MTSRLTHLDEEGRARMVDIGEKAVTHRVCIARAEVWMAAATLDSYREVVDAARRGRPANTTVSANDGTWRASASSP